jgi:endogenous inhibitor of DNA gyrase (YacG/DUF329 family)
MPESAAPALCVFCRRQPIDPAWRPFCSERCKIQDLGRWASDAYRIPGEKADRVSEETGEPGEPGEE